MEGLVALVSGGAIGALVLLALLALLIARIVEVLNQSPAHCVEAATIAIVRRGFVLRASYQGTQSLLVRPWRAAIQQVDVVLLRGSGAFMIVPLLSLLPGGYGS